MTQATDLPSKIPKGVYVRNRRYYRVLRNRWIALTPVADGLRALHEALRAMPVDREPRTIGELLALYLRQAEIEGATLREYQRITDARLMHHFGRLPLANLRPSMVAAYLEKRKRDGAAIMGNRERAARLEKRAQSIRDYMLFQLEFAQVTKIECPWFVIQVKRNPPAVVIDDDQAVPEEFKTTPEPPAPRPDKVKIRDALKAGEAVPGCRLVQSDRLDIRE